MALVDDIVEMKNNGMSDADVISALRNKGVSPKEIRDAMSQAKVKIALDESLEVPEPTVQDEYPAASTTPSVVYPQDAPAPPTLAEHAQPENYYPQTPQAYTGAEYYLGGDSGSETISEIAEEVVEEKTREINSRINQVASELTELSKKQEDIKERLKKVEDTIDKLQHMIIGKVGKFGEDAENIHRDLENLHNTVSKLMKPLADSYKEIKKLKKS